MFRQYGDVVRIGPNELSFGDAGAIKYIYGAHSSRITKGPYHSASVYGSPGAAMPNLRDYQGHKIRRRMWDNGFTKAQLKSYEPRVITLLDVLCERLREIDGTYLINKFYGADMRTHRNYIGNVVDMRSWLDYVTFDVMGDLALSKSFGLLRDGKSTKA